MQAAHTRSVSLSSVSDSMWSADMARLQLLRYDLMAVAAQPFQVSAESVQTGEQRGAMYAVSPQRALEDTTEALRDFHHTDVTRIKTLPRRWMDREEPGLRGDARRDMRGDEFPDGVTGEWVGILRQVHKLGRVVAVNEAVAIMWMLDGEVGCDQRISSPVEEARRHPMMLRDGEPLPVVLGRIA